MRFSIFQGPSHQFTSIRKVTYKIDNKKLIILATLLTPVVSLPECPDNIVYSPFQKSPPGSIGRLDNCWYWASCVFQNADETRKQQFSATAFVMGLVPIILRDIAWPERRLVYVSKSLPKLAEMLVRALGVVPVVTKPHLAHEDNTRQDRTVDTTTDMYDKVKHLLPHQFWWSFALSTLGLMTAFAALAVVEIFSKRSSIGCVYPVFAVTWHFVALAPATCESLLSNTAKSIPHETPTSRVPTETFHAEEDSETYNYTRARSDHAVPASSATWPAAAPRSIEAQQGQQDQKAHAIVAEASHIQGRGKPMIVQFIWAVFYAAGSLIYTSIMAVTVIELFVWVVVSVAVAAGSKLLGFLLCMVFEPEMPTRP